MPNALIRRKDPHAMMISAPAAPISAIPRFFDHSTNPQQKSELTRRVDSGTKPCFTMSTELSFASSARSSSYPSTVLGIAIFLGGLSLATTRRLGPSAKARISENPIRTSGPPVPLRTNSFSVISKTKLRFSLSIALPNTKTYVLMTEAATIKSTNHASRILNHGLSAPVPIDGE